MVMENFRHRRVLIYRLLSGQLKKKKDALRIAYFEVVEDKTSLPLPGIPDLLEEFSDIFHNAVSKP